MRSRTIRLMQPLVFGLLYAPFAAAAQPVLTAGTRADPLQGIGYTPCPHRANGFVLAANGTSAAPHQGQVRTSPDRADVVARPHGGDTRSHQPCGCQRPITTVEA